MLWFPFILCKFFFFYFYYYLLLLGIPLRVKWNPTIYRENDFRMYIWFILTKSSLLLAVYKLQSWKELCRCSYFFLFFWIFGKSTHSFSKAGCSEATPGATPAVGPGGPQAQKCCWTISRMTLHHHPHRQEKTVVRILRLRVFQIPS